MSETEKTDPIEKQGISARLVLFAAAFLFWLLLSWPVSPLDGRPLVGDIAAGIVAAGLVALVMRDLVSSRFNRLFEPARYFWAVVYLAVFFYYVLIASFDVMYRVLHPAMPIQPGIVKVKTKLRSDSARTALANSITLTPGTLTLAMEPNGYLYVHWINVKTDDPEIAAQQILGRFEWFIQRIFE